LIFDCGPLVAACGFGVGNGFFGRFDESIDFSATEVGDFRLGCGHQVASLVLGCGCQVLGFISCRVGCFFCLIRGGGSGVFGLFCAGSGGFFGFLATG
jgi:hypothetical protein